MSRFNAQNTPQVGAQSYIQSVPAGQSVRGFEGNVATERTPKSDLFLLAVSFMGGDDNFYEKSDDRYRRLLELCHTADVYTDLEWSYEFVQYLRTVANMRTVSLVIAVEIVRARLQNGLTKSVLVKNTGAMCGNRDVIAIACARADEPAEILAYWFAKYGRRIPWPIRNGIADAAVRLWNERSYIKYGQAKNKMVSWVDVLRLCHPTSRDTEQNVLFEYIRTPDDSKPAKLNQFAGTGKLSRLRVRRDLYAIDREARPEWLVGNKTALRQAGITWEALSEWYPDGMSGAAWDSIIPNMGVMALTRNLRNFDQAGISPQSYAYVTQQLMSPEVIAKSRMLPYRFYQAYRSTEGVRWHSALDMAINYSLGNIPELDGHTLVLVDRSGSMWDHTVSPKSDIHYADAASLFGAAWKVRFPELVDLYQFGSEYNHLAGRGGLYGYQDHAGRPFAAYHVSEQWTGVTKGIHCGRGASVLPLMKKFQEMGGTKTHQAVQETFVSGRHKRVIILTDEQAFASRWSNLPIPHNVPVYVWNFAGYRGGLGDTGSHNRHTFGGLTDTAFQIIPLLEAGTSVGWPWETRPASDVLSDRGRRNSGFTPGGVPEGYNDYFN